jgi:hypothetical protein
MPSSYKVLGQGISERSTKTVSSKRVDAGGVVTVTTSTPHRAVVGQILTITEPPLTNAVGTRAINANLVTLTTNTTNRLIAGDLVTVSESASVTANVTNRVLTASVATLTIGTHRFLPGQTITVAGIDATFNGTYLISSIAATTISYVRNVANVASTASSGTVTGLDPYFNGVFSVASASPTAFTYGVANSVVSASLSSTNTTTCSATYTDDAFNGVFMVEANPSATELSYTFPLSASLSATATSASITHVPWNTIYTSASNANAVLSSLVLCNQTASAANYSIAVSPDDDVDRQNIIQWNGELLGYESITFTTGMVVDGVTKNLMVGCDIPGVSMNAFGMETTN